MKFWTLLRWLGLAAFAAIVLAGWFSADRNPNSRGDGLEVRPAPNLVR
jgi:hypothetical protein